MSVFSLFLDTQKKIDHFSKNKEVKHLLAAKKDISGHYQRIYCASQERTILESVQDFLIKLDIKTCMYSSSGNKHFFTKSGHRQPYQNYEQSRQKLGAILENKVS